MKKVAKHPAGWVAIAVALLGVITLGIVIDDTDHDGTPDRITIELRGAKDGQTPAVGVPTGPSHMTVAGEALEDAQLTHDQQLANERPAGVLGAQLRNAVAQQQAYARSDKLPDLTPLAAPYQRGCRTRLVGNYSSRNGVRPRLFVVHYTVSPNKAGFSDVDGITGYFNTPGSQASSNYVEDRDGNCNLIVRETSKAWTQATFNPVSISVEVINTGTERPFQTAAGYRRLGQIISDASKRWGIPVQRGRVSGCSVASPGIVQHADLGACGGGHGDIRPFDLGPVIQAARAARGGGGQVAHKYAVQCRKLESYRRKVRAHKRTTAAARRNARGRKASLSHRRITCTSAGASRA